MTEPLGSMRRFDGRIVAITGAASGIGAASARRFAAEGARLALCDMRPDALRDSAGELASRDAAYITGIALVVDGGTTALTGQPSFDAMLRPRLAEIAAAAGRAAS